MSIATLPERRGALERPYRAEHEASELRRLNRGRMPKSLHELLAWFAEAMSLETPEGIHPSRPSVWAEHLRSVRVTGKGDIVCAVCGEQLGRDHQAHPDAYGSSALGSPAELGEFRLLMYGSNSATDEDGSYLMPVHRALGEIDRTGRPLMARHLLAVAAAGYDWQMVALNRGWTDEEYAGYLEFALRTLWLLTIDRDERKVTQA